MSKIHPNASQLINEYIFKRNENDQVILNNLRSIILYVDNRIEEDWKWGVPCYNYKGLLCWTAGFKNHVGINFFKGILIEDTYKSFIEDKKDKKGSRFIRFKSLDDINEKVIKDYILQAVYLNEKELKVTKKEIVVVVPEYFQEILNLNLKAKKIFENFAPSHKREYIEWITGAKQKKIREKRIKQTIELLEDGKHLHWKYEKC